MAYYQRATEKTRFNLYIDKLVVVHFIFHLKNDMLILQNKLKHMKSY